MPIPGSNRIASVAVLSLLSISATLRADSLGCAPSSRPVIEALGFFSASLSPQPGVLPEWREAIQTCQGRHVLASILHSARETAQPGAASIIRGTIAADSWSEIAVAARAARIGLLQSCRVGVAPELLTVEIDITWHGAGTRINKFHLSSIDQALPPCSAAADDLWQALFGVELEPGAEVVEIP